MSQETKEFKSKNIFIPKFDKSIDDRLPKNKWQRINKKPDIVIFEGGMLGISQKNKDLIKPINILEKEKDKKIPEEELIKSLRQVTKYLA